jgi:hypothetical protein
MSLFFWSSILSLTLGLVGWQPRKVGCCRATFTTSGRLFTMPPLAGFMNIVFLSVFLHNILIVLSIFLFWKPAPPPIPLPKNYFRIPLYMYNICYLLPNALSMFPPSFVLQFYFPLPLFFSKLSSFFLSSSF